MTPDNKSCRRFSFHPILFIFFYFAGLPTQAVPLPSEIKIAEGVDFSSSNLPIIIIDTFGEEIVDTPRIKARMGIIWKADGSRNHLTDPWNDYDGDIAIELRGSSTARLPKKQYRFETQDDSGNDLNVGLLGFPAENDWVLYGPYDDASLIRAVLSFRLSNEIGRYATRTRYCELVLNGDYRGVYVLMEKLKQDKNRVNISKLTSSENEGDDLTGGYIFKMDKESGENVGGWVSRLGNEYQYHYPKPDEITEAQKDYLRQFVDNFEQSIAEHEPESGEPAYAQIIDVDSFVDHFLLNEFCKNVDAYRISAYFHKDKNSIDGRLVAGPLWDMNLTFGLAWFEQDLFISKGWQVNYNDTHAFDQWLVPFYWVKLGQDGYFLNRVKQRWDELRENAFSHDFVFGLIDSLKQTIGEAEKRNAARWPESTGNLSFEERLNKIKGWIYFRTAWIDEEIAAVTGVTQTAGTGAAGHVGQLSIFPNPFNGACTIQYYVPNTANVSLQVFDARGRRVAILADETQSPGLYTARFSPNAMPSGIYFASLRIGVNRQSRKLLLIR